MGLQDPIAFDLYSNLKASQTYGVHNPWDCSRRCDICSSLELMSYAVPLYNKHVAHCCPLTGPASDGPIRVLGFAV